MDAPIFVVGAPRSGTTLLTAMLTAHSRIAIGPETHFFRLTTPHARKAAVEDRWPEGAVDFMMGLTVAGDSLAHHFGLTRRDVEGYLRKHPPSEQALLESITIPYANNEGKTRWGEKTPNHLLFLRDIRRLYSTAVIIHIIRDPRDTARSIRRLPAFSGSALANAYMWNEWLVHALRSLSSDPASITVRFEQLLEAPERELQRLCAFIGEGYEPTMLDTAQTADNLAIDKEVWKRQVGQPLDPSKANRWKRSGEAPMNRAISVVCHYPMERLGYTLSLAPSRRLSGLWLNRTAIQSAEKDLVALAQAGVLLEPAKDVAPLDLWRLADPQIVICGPPEWSRSLAKDLILIMALLVLLVRRRIMGDPVKYLLPVESGRFRSDRLAIAMIRNLGSKFRANRIPS